MKREAKKRRPEISPLGKSQSALAEWSRVWAWLAALGAAGACLPACHGGQARSQAAAPAPAQASKPTAPEPIARVQGNPFLGRDVFLPPYTNADQARRRLEREGSPDAALIAKIADTPQAKWLGEWSGEIETVAGNFTKAAWGKNKLALMVAYNLPNRDCGQYSKGGAAGGAAYRAWIDALAAGISAGREAVIILEPDALGHLKQCLSDADQKERLDLLNYATETLAALPGVTVYLDAGHSRWVAADEMAARLQEAGIKKARGFALNTSNYIADDELVAYGDSLVALLGEQTHYVIDSSRNGNGPAAGDDWCNPPGRALGRPPEALTGGGALDAFVWAKSPGESDGECGGGPPAGQWFHERALEMARSAAW